MKLSFYGAARAVTGSCHCVECCGRKTLIDCGLQQGGDERNNETFLFQASDMDDVIITHAHIDHSGRLPLLYKQGFGGNIYCTRLTGLLLSIMLRDSAHIQESDAKWENQKGRRAGRPDVEPLYTLADAERALRHIVTLEYGDLVPIAEGIELRFSDAGHLLGSACIELWLTEAGQRKKIVFSGDLGNLNQPIIRDPQPIHEADYVVTESTYGDRLHETSPSSDYTTQLAAIIDETLSGGGNVIIPSFAVGRTQELLYFIREMKERNLVPSVPNFQVYVDSPLAGEATSIFSGDLHGYLDDSAMAVAQGGSLFQFSGLNITESGEESKGLNLDPTPKVIISASGMCEAGRIRHHLKHNLWRSDSAIVFVGYQAEGSLGRRLVNGIDLVKLFGEEIRVRAKIVNFHGLSGHADRDALVGWMEHFDPKPQEVFVVHGEEKVTDIYAQTLRDRGFSAHAANLEECYDLLTNRILSDGYIPQPKARRQEEGFSPVYLRLEDAGAKLQSLISAKRGAPNKELGKFADQLLALMEKWDK